MSRQTMQFGAILCLVAMISFSAWPFWNWLYIKAANADLQERTRVLVETHPGYKAAWKIAMKDGVLTEDEANEILQAASEKADSN